MSVPRPLPGGGPRDPGLQAERTTLAWNRTGLSVLVNALLVLRSGWTSDARWLAVVGALLVVAAGAAIAYGAWRRHVLRASASAIAPSHVAMAATAGIGLLAGAAGVAAMLVGR